MDVVLPFLIGIALFAMGGHILWLAIGGSFRVLARMLGPEQRDPIQAEMCPVCGEAWKKNTGLSACPLCEWSKTGPLQKVIPNPARVLEYLRAKGLHYTKAGLITADECALMIPGIVGEKAHHQPAIEPAQTISERTTPETADHARQQPGPSLVPVLPAAQCTPAEPPLPGLSAAQQAPEPASMVTAPEPTLTVARSQPWLALFSRFLEEKNIRWGELVGGMLIVGCSLALVISFWSSIAERPFLKFGLFNGVTALLCLLAIRAEKYWQLPRTARGLFVIATMLVPLNFLAISSFSHGETTVSSSGVLGILGAIGVSTWFTLRAGKSLIPDHPVSLVMSVLFPSMAMLLGRQATSATASQLGFLTMNALPYLGQGLGIGVFLARKRHQLTLDEHFAHQLLRLLGLSSFAVALSVGLILSQGGPALNTLRHLAPLAPVLSAPVLVSGLFLWRRMKDPALVSYQTMGIAISVAGVFWMVAGVALGWPDPANMLPGFALCFVILSIISWGLEIPWAHVLAGICLMFAYVLGWHVGTKDLGWTGITTATAQAKLASGQTGTALVPFVVITMLIVGPGLRTRYRSSARAYALAAGLASVISLGLVAWFGFGRPHDPAGVIPVFITYAVLALISAGWFGRKSVGEGSSDHVGTTVFTGLSSTLALGTFIQATVPNNSNPTLGWAYAILAHATLCFVAALSFATLQRFKNPAFPRISRNLEVSAGLSTLVGTLMLALAAIQPNTTALTMTKYLIWLAFLLSAFSWRFVNPIIFATAQATLSLAGTFAVADYLQHQDWFRALARPWADPWTVQTLTLAIGGICLMWIGLRLLVRTWRQRGGRLLNQLDQASLLLEPNFPALDRWLRGAVVCSAVGLACYAVIPGVLQENSLRDSGTAFTGVEIERIITPLSQLEIPGVPHEHALGAGSWLVLAMAIVVLLAGHWERFRKIDTLAALAVASLAAPLVAARWETQTATATALYWASMILFPILSSLVWNRRTLAALGNKLGWVYEPEQVSGLASRATFTVFLTTLLPFGLMITHVVSSLLSRQSPAESLQHAWGLTGLLTILLVIVSVLLRVWHNNTLLQQPDHFSPWFSKLRPASSMLAYLAPLPVVATTAFVIFSLLVSHPLVGRDPDSLFTRLGDSWFSSIPLVLFAATLIGYAIRERSPRFAFGAGLMFSVAAMSAYLFSAATAGAGVDGEFWVRVLQINMIMLSAYTLLWIGSLRLWARNHLVHLGENTQSLQALLFWLGLVLNMVLLSVGSLSLLVVSRPALLHQTIAGPWGLLAAGLSFAVFQALVRQKTLVSSTDWIGCWWLIFATLLPLGLATQDTGNALTSRGLIVGWSLVGFGLLLMSWQKARLKVAAISAESRVALSFWVGLCLALVVIFALFVPGLSNVWRMGSLASMVVLSALLAISSTRARYITLAGLLGNATACVFWFNYGWIFAGSRSSNLIMVNVVALAAPVAVWLWIDRRYLRPARDEALQAWPYPWQDAGFRLAALPYPRNATWIALATLAFIVAMHVQQLAHGFHLDVSALLVWLAMASVAGALTASLWDGRERAALLGIYVLGLCACGWSLVCLQVLPEGLAWTGTLLLGSYSLVSSYLWNQREKLRGVASLLGIPQPRAGDPEADLTWLVPANLTIVATVVCLSIWSILTEPTFVHRTATAHAVLAQVLALGLIARGARRSQLQLAALSLGALGAVAWGWAAISPTDPSRLIDRITVVIVSLVGVSTLYGLGLSKLTHRLTRWETSARRLVPVLMAVAGSALALVLFTELSNRVEARIIPISSWSIAVVSLSLLGAAAAALVAAVVPGRDPLGLSRRQRTGYVYAAEFMLAALILHVGMTMPWLFTGWLAQYWSLIILGVAFMGAGLSEFFHRKGQEVLAEPFANTGALLPLLPLLAAFWSVPKAGEDVVFLIVTGGLYATLALVRSSSLFATLSMLAFNACLWTILGRTQSLGLAQHPQLWVIPPAICVLVASFLNRKRLTLTQTSSIRSVALLAIYVSSTADIVFTGVAQAPWLPLVLGALAITGVFLGILLQIRNFLFMGVSFLSLAIFSMIKYAAVDLHQTWLWWACGIVAGFLILALFAMFEKKRTEILCLVDQVKLWKA